MQRATQLGQAAVSSAVEFVKDFAKQLLGNAADTMQLTMNSVQLSANAGYSSLEHATANGQTASTTVSQELQTSSDFVGTGTLVTSDGKKFTFQVEVQLQTDTQMDTRTASGDPATGTDNATTSTSTSLPMHTSTGTNTAAAAAATATATTAQAQSSVIGYCGSLENLLALLHQGRFSQPIQVYTDGSSAGVGGTKQSGVLQFSLLNQLPTTGLSSAAAGSAQSTT